jgi:hypothetical protein
MRSFPALMLLLAVEYAVYALLLRPVLSAAAEILQVIAELLETTYTIR